MEQKIVAVLGPGNITEDSKKFKEAVSLGTLFAQKNYQIMTGGYGGIMEAAARGAQKAGGESIGVTLKQKPNGNKFLTKIIIAEGFFDRLETLMSCDAFVIFPGGSGTSLELVTLLHLIKVENIIEEKRSSKPIIVIGSEKEKIEIIEALDYFNFRNNEINFLLFCETTEEAVDILK